MFNSSSVLVVLGHPWLSFHNPHINWADDIILYWSSRCHVVCLVSAVSPVSVSSVFIMICVQSSVSPELLFFLLTNRMIALSISSQTLLRLEDVSSPCPHLNVRPWMSVRVLP